MDLAFMNIALTKIATMLGQSVADTTDDALELYIVLKSQLITDYDNFFGTKEEELFKENKFDEFLAEISKGNSDMAMIAHQIAISPHKPVKVWNIDQLIRFSYKYSPIDINDIKQLWREYGKWSNNDQ